MLPIYIRVRSEYFEHDSSRYRLAITQNTLIQSLKKQTYDDFTVILMQSPMDPYYTRRSDSFAGLGNDHVFQWNTEQPHIEVEVGDDDFLCPTFIESIRKIPSRQENSFLTFPNGYIFSEGKLRVWRGRDQFVPVTMWIRPGEHVGQSIEASSEPSWIYVRHSMNSTLIPHQQIVGNQINGLKWAGWKENVVARYCKTAVRTATCNGSTLHPTKSKSVIYAKGSQRGRK